MIIQPRALLATMPATTSFAALSDALAEHHLCLPVDPLCANLSIAEAIAANHGGRRRLAHGPISRYLRGAQIATPHGLVQLGGPTLKRATGYGLHRAPLFGGELREVTLSVRPLPPARQLLRLACADEQSLATAAQTIIAHYEPSALPFRTVAAGYELLIELEGAPAVLARHIAALHAAFPALAAADPSAWQPYSELAAAHRANPLALDLHLPRTNPATLLAHLRSTSNSPLWGDAGIIAAHLAPADAAQRHSLQTWASHHQLAEATEFTGLHAPPPAWPHIQALPSLNRSTPAALLDQLRAIVGPRGLLTRAEELFTYEQDASIAHGSGAPLAAVLPTSTAQVAAIAQAANAANVPIVVRGAGSGLAGGSIPDAGALLLALTRLDQISVDPIRQIAHVGAGAVTADLQRAAEQHGLFYPPDPSSQTVSTIGGNIACNAGGPRCLKYGVTADYVLELEAVLADGQIVRYGEAIGGQSATSALNQLLIGSEGTLALVTAATLRLIRRPAAQRTTLAFFANLRDACATVEAIMAGGLIPAGLELMDDATIAAVEGYLGLGLPRDAQAMLLLLADGEPEAVAADAERLAQFARAGGASSVRTARDSREEAELWRARRAVAPALARIKPNRLGEDISVPVDRIADCVAAIKQIATTVGQPIVVFGHAGDGNLHPNILFDSRDPAEQARTWQAAEAIFSLALDLGGTLSGEHGIGTLKRPFMTRALGETGLALQRAIKAHFDPRNLLNPGKVLP